MFFQVDTRHGPMQAECPPGVEAGSAILVSVPAPGALPVVTAQPLVAVGQPVAIAVHGAPIAQAMERSKMEGRMAEAKSGCYVYKPNPLCGMEFLRVSETEIMGGPLLPLWPVLLPVPHRLVRQVRAHGSSQRVVQGGQQHHRPRVDLAHHVQGLDSRR